MSSALTDQIEALHRDSLTQGFSPAVAAALVQTLVAVAQNCKHLEYSILTYADGGRLTVADAQGQPWVPAFGYSQDAEAWAHTLELPLVPSQMGILSLLLLSLGMKQALGMIFYDHLGQPTQGQPIAREQLMDQLHAYLRRTQQDGSIT